MSWSTVDEARMRQWTAEPHVFVRQALGATPHAWQDEELTALPTTEMLAIAGSKGSAKSTLFAWSIWWFLFCHFCGRAVVTSGGKDQLRDTLWPELAKWHTPLLKHVFHWGPERIVRKSEDLKGKWWASARTWNKDADPHTQGQALAGVHGHPGMIVLDESGGMPVHLAATAQAILATKKNPADRIFVLTGGNTTTKKGLLYHVMAKQRDIWRCRRVTSDPDDPLRSPNVSVEWARQQIKAWGRDNPFVKVNVFAEFPEEEFGRLVSLLDMEQAMERRTEEDPRQPLILGVDVGLVNDAAVVYPRRGRLLYPPVVMRGQSTIAIAGKVTEMARELKATAVFIDAGGPGIGVIDQCRAFGLQVVPVFFGQTADDSVRYADKRTEMYVRFATWLKEGGCIDPHTSAELVQDMLEPEIGWKPVSGQQVLEPKDEVKKRLHRSTDWSDGAVLTFAFPVAAPPIDAPRHHHATPDPRVMGRYARDWGEQSESYREPGFGG